MNLLVLLLISSFAHAKMDLPPPLRTEKDYAAYAEKIRQALPEVYSRDRGMATDPTAEDSLHALIAREQQLVERLRGDPEYMALARRRPPLKIIAVQRVKVESERFGATEGWKNYLKMGSYESRRSKPASLAELRDLLKNWPRFLPHGFFGAWAGLLSLENRGVLHEPDIEVRWSLIKSILAGFEMHFVRSQFRATNFGVNRGDWTLSDLDDVVSRMAQYERRIAVLMQEIRSDEEPWFLTDIEGFENRDLKLLRNLASSLARRFSASEERVEKVTRQLLLRELPPFLAIYRGCVGSDCSTTASWAFPYSPSERYWWIEESDGTRIGYASGAITRVDGQPTLYIRDITGPALRSGDVTLIVQGLYRAREAYGADRVTLMSEKFSSQNHFSHQQQELQALSEFTNEVVQRFDDSRIRSRFLIRFSQAQYDAIDIHTRVRQLNFTETDLLNVRGVDATHEFPNLDLKEDPNRIWILLSNAIVSGDVRWLESALGRKVDWTQFLATIRNEKRLSLDGYRAETKRAFARAEIPLSDADLKRNSRIFLAGEKAAPDSLKRPEFMKELIQAIFEAHDYGRARELASGNLELLEESRIFHAAVAAVIENRTRYNNENEDIEFLWSIGYRFKKFEAISKEALFRTINFSEDNIEFVMWAIDLYTSGERLWKHHAGERVASFVVESYTKLVGANERVDLRRRLANFLYENPSLIGKALNWYERVETLNQETDLQALLPFSLSLAREFSKNDPDLRDPLIDVFEKIKRSRSRSLSPYQKEEALAFLRKLECERLLDWK